MKLDKPIEQKLIGEKFTSDDLVIEGRVLEMSFDNSLINVPVHPRVDVSTLTADDDDPKFVNVEVIRAGISKTNRRRYSNGIVDEINEMIPGTQGFLGHPDPSKHGFEFRDPQCIYVGSMTETMPDGMKRSVAKAYLFKTSPLREWIPKSIAANNPMTVSINGTGDVIRNGDILDVLHMSNLESIDWANPGTEGMGTSKAMTIVSEMQINTGGNEMDSKDVIKGATVMELKAYNPEAVTALLSGVTVTELQAANPNLCKEIAEATKITEMQLDVAGEQKTVKISELQAMVTDYEKTISTLKGENDNLKIMEFKNKKLAELVPENLRESVSKRVVGITEQAIEDSINAEITYIREMGGMSNNSIGKSQHKGGDDVKEAVRTMFCGAKKEDK